MDKKEKKDEPLHPGYHNTRYEALCNAMEQSNNGNYQNPLIAITFSKNRYEAICEMTDKLNGKCDSNPKRKVTSLVKWKRLIGL
jgi:hypothetical protein